LLSHLSATPRWPGRPRLSDNAPPIVTPLAGADPLPLAVQKSPLWRVLSPLLSAAILVVIVYRLRELDMAQLRAVVPSSPAFWVVFVFYYFVGVLTDFAIFRRLWRIPAEGLVALSRKMISNELVLGYVGEVYFYSWARRKIAMTASPFGAVKDVAILSAVVGNICTLIMIAAAWPLIANLNFPIASRTIVISMAVMIALSMVPLLFGKQLFSLARRDLWYIAAMHFLRIFLSLFLAGVAWSLALPAVALSWWVILATLRMLISRLPFVPQKDIMFAGTATFLVGHDLEIAALMAFMAAITLATHLVLGALLAIGDFINLKTK